MGGNHALLKTSSTIAATANSDGADTAKKQATAALLPKAGSLHPQPELTARQRLWLLLLVIAKRVRFLAVLAAVGAFIGYFDAVKLHWDRWVHPSAAAVRHVPAGKEFFCPMDPQVTRVAYEANGDVPGCPICGMPLSLHDRPANEELPPGVIGRVNISPERVAMAGIRTVTVDYRPMARQTKTMGHVTVDESRTARVISRVEGYVEKLCVAETFASVRKGDPLAEIYSPRLNIAARRLVLAAKDNADSELIASLRGELLLQGGDSDDIDRMVAAGEVPTRLVIRSPQSGCVMEKKIVFGASVEPKATLFEIADLSSVLVEAEVYQKDLVFLSVGQAVDVKVDAWPQRTFRGELAVIDPRIEMAARTNRIRVRLDNAGGELRPGMHADVKIETPLETIEPYKSLSVRNPPAARKNQDQPAADSPPAAPPSTDGPSATAASAGDSLAPRSSPEATRAVFLVVPESAIIDTGDQTIVYVESAEGQFEGHEVELGPRHNGSFPVLKGLSAGDKVAMAGSFLVDAETRLNPAVASTYFGAGGGETLGASPSAAKGAGNAPLKPALRMQPLSDDQLKNIDQLPGDDRAAAKAQNLCPVMGVPLGSMGVPVKITLRGKPVFLCCKGCVAKAKRDPRSALKSLEKIRQLMRQSSLDEGC